MPSPTLRPKYDHQIIALVDKETAGRIEDEAERYGISKSEVMRTYLVAGMQAADELDEELSS